MAIFDLSDEEWAVIQPLLPKKGRGPARKDYRTVLNGIFLRSSNRHAVAGSAGAIWPHTTICNRYRRWDERGIWQGVFEVLATDGEGVLIFVNSSIVKAHRAVSGAKGRS